MIRNLPILAAGVMTMVDIIPNCKDVCTDFSLAFGFTVIVFLITLSLPRWRVLYNPLLVVSKTQLKVSASPVSVRRGFRTSHCYKDRGAPTMNSTERPLAVFNERCRRLATNRFEVEVKVLIECGVVGVIQYEQDKTDAD